MKKISFIAIWLLALVVIACALLVYENDLLWKMQEMNLFLNTSLYFKQQMVVSGGLLTYLGTFFTQFLHHPTVGVLMLCAWWLLLMGLVKRTFQVPDKWAVLMLIPVTLLLLTIVDQGYWVYFLKLRGHFFVATIGCTAVVALLWCFRCLTGRFFLRTIFLLVVAVAGYPLMGIYGLAAVLLMAIWSWRLQSRGTALLNSVVAVLGVVAVPLLCYRYVYHETNITNIYFTELPLYYLVEEYHQYYIPFYLLLLYFVVMACVPWKRMKMKTVAPIAQKPAEASEPQLSRQERRKQQKMGKPARAARKPVAAGKWRRWAPTVWTVVIVALLTVGVAHFWFKDSNYHRELRMQHCIEQHDWEGVISEAAAQEEEPTRAIVMMKNLALSRLGRQSTEMYNFKNGSKKSKFYDPLFHQQDAIHVDVRMMQVVGMLIYYQYGKLNDCARLAMEMGVEYDWRPVYYKYLTRCAILDGDKSLAKKYIHILKNTTFFKDWAAWAENLLNHPEQIAKDPEMEPITHMLHYPNELSSDNGFVEEYLMKHLAHTNYVGDPVFQEQCLLASMWLKVPEFFWYQFTNYVKLHPNDKIPLYYQQAAYTFGVEEKRPDLDSMPFDPGVKTTYEQFSQAASQYDGLDMEEARKLLYPLFGNTYFYDYYLMSNLPQY
ncbi:MAG: hypothetical protein J5529_00845 [Prevotella sp.]|nr:hypothetical protein [Prevotella sp.]